MTFYFQVFLLFTLVMVSCKPESKIRTESLEIYNTIGTDANLQAGELKYYETTEYKGTRKISTTYYDAKGGVKGKEVFTYSGQDTVPVGANYFDTNNDLLSYYKYIFNNKGQMVTSFAFDAANHELLRVEKYNYLKGNLESKQVLLSTMQPSRRYAFDHDTFGNEIAFKVYNQADSIMAYEQFKITKKDEKNKWIEKWGLVNGRPKTFHKRK